MAFGLNKAQLIGRLGADAVINALTNGGRVANLSVATDEGYIARDTGERVDRTEWHRVVTFQDGMVTTLEKHAKKGRLVFVEGKLQTRKWTDANGNERYSTEILVVPGGHRRGLHRQGHRRARRPDRVAPRRHLPGRHGHHAGEAREEGPPGLCRGQAPDPQVDRRQRQRALLDRDPGGPGRIPRIQFIDKPNGASAPAQQPPTEQAPGAADMDDEIPF